MEKKDFEYIILWMLNNNEECNWSVFLDEPLEISLATLSKYMKLLISNGYVEKKSKGVYLATAEGKKRYIDLKFKDSFERKLRYPPEIILNKRNYAHIILWMLFNNDYLKWSDFIEKPLSLNHNSLSKYLNLLMKKGFVDSENMEYRITRIGEERYNKMLKRYQLDYQSVLEEEIDKIESIKENVRRFLKEQNVEDSQIEILFLDLINHLNYSFIENILPSKEDFYKILLFLSINHPSRYPEYISQENFSLKYNIKLATLTFCTQKITEEDLYDTKFFNLRLNDEVVYYFREDDKIDKMLHLIIDENILKFSYLKRLQPDISKEERNSQTVDLLDNILNDISDKLFDRNIKSPLKKFVPDYINFLFGKYQKETISDDLVDKFKGLAFQNIINLKLEDYNRIKREKTILTSILKDFPKYKILDEINKKLKEQE
ncbi:MAG: winged helix-turn-helix domain-containing protein [Promethearchaeota archaeon]